MMVEPVFRCPECGLVTRRAEKQDSFTHLCGCGSNMLFGVMPIEEESPTMEVPDGTRKLQL